MPKNISEFQIIEQFFKPLTKGCKASLELCDDVAEISLLKNQQLVVSKDMMVENVHFLFADGGFKIASKLLRSNLSDIASSGAKPCYYMLGFSKNSKIDRNFLKEFASGLKSVQDEFNIKLIGGDTVSSDQLTFSITIFGVIENNKKLSRNKAKSGDLIYVSGIIGDAYLGFNSHKYQLTKEDKNYLLNRHFFPTPRIELGQKLAKLNLSKCAIDVSDGLLADLKHICQSSKLEAKIYSDKIPFSKAAKKILQKNNIFSELVSGGDDYELIFTINKKYQKKIAALSKELKLDLTCIGEMFCPLVEPVETKDKNFYEIKILDKENKKLRIKKYGYEH
ncbi:MAG: thiamine-phosphate kinase [Rickettsiales bacterium]|nr:thiamine-phosphate kinase [Rickettsiales bacterium]